MTTTAMHPDTSKALALLAVGHTVQAVADHITWPVTSVRALANGQRGWLVDSVGRVYDPGKPHNKVQVPDSVDVADLAWARQLLSRTAAARSDAKAKAPAKPTPSQVPTSPNAGSSPAETKPAAAVRGAAAIDGPITTELPLSWIHPNTGNIRESVGDVTELAASITAHGLLQPLTVRPHPVLSDQYQLLAGHRRHAAALEAGLTHAPVVIRYDITEATAVEVMLVENLQRRDLGAMEKAEAFGRLRDQHGYTATKIGQRTGVSGATVGYFLALLDLDETAREKVRTGELAVGDAIETVRRQRAKARAKAGGAGAQNWSWEPDYLTKTHPLAKKATRYCDARGHTARRRVGQVACGQCWETAIRKDEQVVIGAQQGGEA